MRKDLVEPLVALVLLVLATPLLVLIATAVKCSSPGPVLFRRRVLGKGGCVFDALKFRTMVLHADQVLAEDASLRREFEVSYKLERDPRVTRLGRLLRRYSLDELPQLANVVRGEMALVGPRMISPDELPRYGQLAERLLTVKPGLTGLWQVSGRQTVSFARRLELDMFYVEHQSARLDLAILLRTPLVVFRAEGAF